MISNSESGLVSLEFYLHFAQVKDYNAQGIWVLDYDEVDF